MMVNEDDLESARQTMVAAQRALRWEYRSVLAMGGDEETQVNELAAYGWEVFTVYSRSGCDRLLMRRLVE